MKKKILIILGILALLVNLLPAYAISDSDFYVETAQHIGIVSGYSDGSLRPGSFITRAEFAAIAYRISTGKLSIAPSYNGPQIFKDVSPKDWSYGFIYYCYNMKPKLLAGYPDGTFRPKNNITNAEVIKVFTQILYKSDTPLVFPYGYIDKAKEFGILTGLDNLDWIQPATRATVCRIAVNILTSASESIAEEVSLLLKNFGISTFKCKILGTKDNNAEEFSLTQSFVAKINDSKTNELLTADYSYNIDDFIGYNVLLFYKDKNGNKKYDMNEGTPTWSSNGIYQINVPTESIITITKSDNKTMSGNLTDIKKFVSNTDGSFFYNNREYFYARDALYIINGKVIDKGSQGESRFEGFFGTAGRFTMVDTNEDGVYDSCLIITD